MQKAGLVFGGMVALVLAFGTASAEEKSPSIKQIMQTVAGVKKEKGLCGKCSDAAKAEKWDDAQKLAKALNECCASLPKHPAPKGDEKKWEELAKKFAEQAQVIAKATDEKDPKAVSEAIGAFTKACGTCHMSFKGKK
jgi:cytochrome c556